MLFERINIYIKYIDMTYFLILNSLHVAEDLIRLNVCYSQHKVDH